MACFRRPFFNVFFKFMLLQFRFSVINVHDQADAGHGGEQGRTTVGKEDQWNTSDWHYAHYHSYVDKEMEGKHTDYSGADV